jgi:hypothetical protein
MHDGEIASRQTTVYSFDAPGSQICMIQTYPGRVSNAAIRAMSGPGIALNAAQATVGEEEFEPGADGRNVRFAPIADILDAHWAS